MLVAAAQSLGDSIGQLAGAMLVMGLVLLIGRLVRRRVRAMQALFLPTSVVAGVLAMLLGPQVFGALASLSMGEEAVLAGGLIPQ